MQSDIFKFVTLRSPVPADKNSQAINFIADSRNPAQTPVGSLVTGLGVNDGAKVPEIITRLIKTKGYAPDFPGSEDAGYLLKIRDLVDNPGDEITTQRLQRELETIIDGSIKDFLKNSSVEKIRDGIWDRYYAFYILGRTEPQNLDSLTQNLRLFHLLDSVANNVAINDRKALASIMGATPLIQKLFVELPKPPVKKTEPPKEAELPAATVKRYKEIWNDYISTHRAIDEVKNLEVENKTTAKTTNVTIPNRETGSDEKGRLTMLTNKLIVSSTSFNQLHPDSQAVLKNMNISVQNLQIPNTVAKLTDKLSQINQVIANINEPKFIEFMPEDANLIPGSMNIVSRFNPLKKNLFDFPFFPPVSARALIKPLGIGDLRVVKQKLKKYVAGEISFIENILKGESKERKHRVLDRTEDILTVSNETDEETTKDTQTTERFELKKESEKTIQEQMSVQAGVTVSGSYGMVTMGAHADFAYSTSSQESNKSASNFAREVVDKSVTKIQKRSKEEKTTKKLHEVEEINDHGFVNVPGTEHIVGIYRWVDKYYEAQIYNYGVRMMFEFIIPEPAAFYKYAQTHKPKQNIAAPAPLEANLTHKNIDRNNYQNYIRDYNVQGATPPPLPFKTISTAIKKEGMPLDGNGHVENSKELVVPAGYFSQKGVWFDASIFFRNYPKFEITIGNKIFRLLNNPGAVEIADNNWLSTEPFHFFMEGSPIQISTHSYDVISYTINAYAFVELTSEAYEQWQITTFEKIKAAYSVLQADYEQKLAARDVQQGQVHGQNPRINREIEQTELKKHCIKMLMNFSMFGTFDAMEPGTESSLPDFDVLDAIGEGKIIQFYEQAFEWENITYLFYPYFWGRKNNWIENSTTYDTDPLFTKFLQSGSARAVIPVHPAYNDAIMYFLENGGAIWGGGESPRLKDPMFISIADELRDQTDDLAKATPEGEPWEVILPTTLVYLQQDSTLPTFP